MTTELQLTAPLPWQLTQWDYLLKRREQNNLPHALLFYGIAGLGKQSLAVEFAKTLFCAQKNNQVCGYCSACQLIKAKSHPDFYHLQPEEPGKAIRIDQIRELTAQFSQTSQQGGYKIALIEPADALNTAAANALLKTLEEPTPNTLVILITSQPSFLSATIRSRCQSINFLPPENNVAEAWLNKYDHSDWTLLLALAEGAPLKALEFSDPDFLKQRANFFRDFATLSLEKSSNPIEMAGKWFKSDLRQIINWLKVGIIDMIRLQNGVELSQLMNRDCVQSFEMIVQKINAQRLYSYLDKLYKVSQELNIVSLQQQLVLEDLLCTWCAHMRN